MWDLNELTNTSAGISSTTLDKPQWQIANSVALGAPVQVRISGDIVAVNSIDNSIKVFRLIANGVAELVSLAAGDVAQAWRFELLNESKQIVTSMFGIRRFDLDSMKQVGSEVTFD